MTFDTTQGSCYTLDPTIFYPEGSDLRTKTATAKLICSSCPVTAECLKQAIDNNEWGIWAGSTMKQRGFMRRSPQRQALHLRNLANGIIRMDSIDNGTLLD